MTKNGFTLVELLVGLLIAMLCMIMMLTIFRQIVHISSESTQDAEYDTQIKTGMLVMERLIQNAGFGSGLASDIKIATYNNRPTVFWRYISDLNAVPVAYECQAITEQIIQENKFEIHRLVLLRKAACGTTTALEEGDWEVYQPIASIRNQQNTPIFQYTLAEGACRPFGIDQTSIGVRHLTLSASRQHTVTGLGSQMNSIICLNNIKATT